MPGRAAGRRVRSPCAPAAVTASRAASTASDQSAARAGPHQPAGSTSPQYIAATWRGCAGSAASTAASCVVGRPVVDAERRRRRRIDRRQEHQADLVQREVAMVASDGCGAASRRGRAAASYASAVPRPTAGSPAVRPPGADRRQPSPSDVQRLGRQERVGDDLDETTLGQRSTDRTSAALVRRSSRCSAAPAAARSAPGRSRPAG